MKDRPILIFPFPASTIARSPSRVDKYTVGIDKTDCLN